MHISHICYIFRTFVSHTRFVSPYAPHIVIVIDFVIDKHVHELDWEDLQQALLLFS